MRTRLGIDATDIDRFKALTQDREHPFFHKTFSKKELAYCFSFADPAPHLAGMFAAKEAVTKAFVGKYHVTSIEIRYSKTGAPEAWRGKKKLPITVSITHERGLAIAAAVG